MRKGVKSICVALALCVSASTAALGTGFDADAASGTWKHDSKGYWYRYTDGTYAKNQWLQVGGKWYYFNADGYMRTGWLQSGWSWYYLNTTSGAMVKGWAKIGGKWYYFNPSGAMATGWKKVGGKWYYFKGSGEMVTGWRQVGASWYYFNSNGVMLTGTQTIGGVKYVFDSNGRWIDETSAYQVGDIITFGKYEQDNDTVDGTEAIQWRVLSKSGKAILVESVNALDAVPYNETGIKVTWETCSLRKWLNEDFYNSAFTAAEKKKIQTVTLTNSDNTKYGTTGGKNTDDKIFVLSLDEAKRFNSMTQKDNGFYMSANSICKVTAYAKSKKAAVSSARASKDNCWYWLRTPGMTSDYAVTIDTDGYAGDGGLAVTRKDIAVRPVMWITP